MAEHERRRVSKELHEQLPPFDLGAEEGVLGSALLSPDCLDDLALVLSPSDFYDPGHATLFARLLAMQNDGKRIDTTLLVTELTTHGELAVVGGIPRLAELSRRTPYARNALYYANSVRDCATKRALIHAGSDLLRMGYGQVGAAADLVARAEALVFEIRDNRLNDSHVSDIRTTMMRAFDALSERMDGKSTVFGKPTGFPDLDSIVALRPGNLMILSARPGMGKTAFALNIARNIAETEPVLVFTMEMDSLSLSDRMLAAESAVNIHKMRNGFLGASDREQLVEAAARLSRVALTFDDATDRNVNEMAAIARRLKRRAGTLGLVVVDYLQLIRAEDGRAPREQQIARMTAELKKMAREIDCPLLCLAQLNRQAESSGGKPRLSQLRESGAIEQDADVVVFLHRPEYYAESDEEKARVAGQAEAIVAKNRNGPTGALQLHWESHYTRFVNRSNRPDSPPFLDGWSQ